MAYTVENGYVQIPESEFKGMLEDLRLLKEREEEQSDIAALDHALALKEEAFPGKLAKQMIEGASPIRVFREYRGLTQQMLADTTGLSKTTISEIETGRKDGSIKSMSAIAEALGVDVDDLI